MQTDKKELAKMIDHTLLKPDATKEQIRKLCSEAKKFGFASVCVNSYYTDLVSNELKGSDVKTCVVVGFPLGAMLTDVKVCEAGEAVKNGAQEIDMVINVGALKNQDYDYVEKDIKAVVDAVCGKALVKVIIETCFLTDEEKIIACKLAQKAGAHFVKTSTGFGPGGATVQDVKLMRETVGNSMGVKASGGIRDYEKAAAMIEAGANRIGASSSVDIVIK
ncbi:MAG: deoxyribose-phosphate aldolase [Clostridiaceae bacterium]|nr:deoxyribose-phosphate aldolase [Clostridiaceae bacterium]